MILHNEAVFLCYKIQDNVFRVFQNEQKYKTAQMNDYIMVS